MGIKILKKDGYLVFVHPGLWRQYENKTYMVFKKYNLKYLKLRNEDAGRKLFKAATRYEYYVLQKSNYEGVTIIDDDTKTINKINLDDWEKFLPNSNYDMIKELLAKDGEEKTDITSNSSYHHTLKYISKIKTPEHKYPIVYSINKDEPVIYWSSINTRKGKHFGYKKLIYSNGAGLVLDDTGKYGMSQFATGIIDNNVDNLKRIKVVFESKIFKILANALAISQGGGGGINQYIIKLFKKDFWKKLEKY